MFMNIDSSYKDLFCCFCLIFTTVFQIFWVPASSIDQSFLVGEPQGRGTSSVWLDTQRHRTCFLTRKRKFTSIVLTAARSSPAPQCPSVGRAGASYHVQGVGAERHPRAPAAPSRGSPPPFPSFSAWRWKIPELFLLLCWAGASCEPSRPPGFPSAKMGTTKWLQPLKEFWELLTRERSAQGQS